MGLKFKGIVVLGVFVASVVLIMPTFQAYSPGGKPQGQPNGNRADGNDAQFGGVGQGKNGSRPPRQRSANRSPNANRADRSGKGSARNRGKGRSR